MAVRRPNYGGEFRRGGCGTVLQRRQQAAAARLSWVVVVWTAAPWGHVRDAMSGGYHRHCTGRPSTAVRSAGLSVQPVTELDGAWQNSPALSVMMIGECQLRTCGLQSPPEHVI